MSEVEQVYEGNTVPEGSVMENSEEKELPLEYVIKYEAKSEFDEFIEEFLNFKKCADKMQDNKMYNCEVKRLNNH